MVSEGVVSVPSFCSTHYLSFRQEKSSGKWNWLFHSSILWDVKNQLQIEPQSTVSSVSLNQLLWWVSAELSGNILVLEHQRSEEKENLPIANSDIRRNFQ